MPARLEDRPKKADVFLLPEDQHREMLSQIVKVEGSRYAELKTALSAFFRETGFSITEQKSRDLINWYKLKGMLVHNGQGGQKSFYFLPQSVPN